MLRFIFTDPCVYWVIILGPRSLSFTAFGAPSRGAFVLVRLEGETLHGVVDNHLVAVGSECFLFPWGFVLTAADTDVALASATAAAAAAAAAAAITATATLGECCHETCVLCHDFQYLLALLRKFGL
jgi:hypothetical protein